MNIQNNVQILVVDDHYNEVCDLLHVLTKNGLSYAFNDCTLKTRPSKKNLYHGVRFVILDIDIDRKTTGLPQESKASTLALFLESLISPDNGPIFILFCTNDADLVDLVKKNLARTKLILAGYSLLEKESGKVGPEALDKLKEALNGNILPDSFKFFLSWEQNVSKIQSSFINSFASLQMARGVEDPDEKVQSWDNSIKNVLCALTESQSGKNWDDLKADSSNLSHALTLLNHILIGKLPHIASFFNLPDSYEVSLDTVSQVNTNLFLDKVVEKEKIETGRVFYNTNEKILADLKNGILESSDSGGANVRLITTVITPQCDIAKTKMLTRNSNEEWHTLLHGLEIEINDDMYKKMLKKSNGYTKKINYINSLTELQEPQKAKLRKYIAPQHPDCIFKTWPIINSFGKKCIWVFHFSTVSVKVLKKNKLTFDYQMSKELFFDLQSKLSNHMNRLGNSMLEC